MPTKIGLIGCGEWGKNILRDLKTLNCHVSTVCQSIKSYEYAKQGHADNIYDSIDQLHDVDGIIIATPSSTHASVIKKAAHLNKPMFVEKPLTVNLSEATYLANELHDRLFVMHKWRYQKGIQTLAEIVKQRELGDIIGIHSTRFNWGNHHPDVDMIWTCLPHDLSITIEILGYMPEPKHAVGLECDNDTVEMICMLGEKPWNVIEISCVRPFIQREVRVLCEYGIASLKDGYASEIEIYHQKEWGIPKQINAEKRQFTNTEPLFEELIVFVNYLRGGPKPKTDAKEGLAVVEAITNLRQLAGIKRSGVLQELSISRLEMNMI